MNKKQTIRVIKKKERVGGPENPAPVPTEINHQQDATDLARTVLGWVREFKKRGSSRAQGLRNPFPQPTPRQNPA